MLESHTGTEGGGVTDRDAKTFWGLLLIILAFFFGGMVIGGIMGNANGFNQGNHSGYKQCITDFKILGEH